MKTKAIQSEGMVSAKPKYLLPSKFKTAHALLPLDSAFCIGIMRALSRMRPSSRGLGHCPFTAATGVRIPVGVPVFRKRVSRLALETLLLHHRQVRTMLLFIEKQHPDAKIKLNTAASGTLLQQLAQGAPEAV